LSHTQQNTDLADDWQSGTEKSISLTLDQAIYTGGQVSAAINEQERSKKVTENQYRSLVNDIILQTVTAYMDVYQSFESVRVNKGNVTLLSKEYDAVRARFDAGELTRTDVAQSLASLSNAKAQLVQEQSEYDIALSDYKSVTTKSAQGQFLYPALDMVFLPHDLDEALGVAMEKNPDVLAEKMQVLANQSNIDEQSGAFYPQLDMNIGATMSRDPVFSNVDRQESANIGLTATLPLYQSGILRNQLRQAKILKEQSQSDVDVTQLEITNQVISAWQNYQSALTQINAREDQLDAAKLAYEGVKLEEENGARSILDVLDVNQDMLNAELSLIDARTNKVKSFYNLLDALGLIDKAFLG